MKLDPHAPAFPESHPENNAPSPGLSVRAHFAGLAMQGLLANPGLDLTDDDTALCAVTHADALIAALNEGGGE